MCGDNGEGEWGERGGMLIGLGLCTHGEVLGADGIEEFKTYGDTEICEVTKKLAGDAETLVNLVGAVDIGIVDEAFPTDSRAWFFTAAKGRMSREGIKAADSQVATHDNEEIGPLGNSIAETTGVLERLLWTVNGAGADDDEDAIVETSDDAGRLVACAGDGTAGCGGGNEFVFNEGGLNEGVVLITVGGIGSGGERGRAAYRRSVRGWVDSGSGRNGTISRIKFVGFRRTYSENTLVVEILVDTLCVKWVRCVHVCQKKKGQR